MPISPPRHLRRFADDPTLLPRLFSLIEAAFPGLPTHAQRPTFAGGQWEDASTPFIVESGSQPIAHIGVLPLPLIAAGRPLHAAGIHAVCTHPAHRNQGHIRTLMADVLPWAQANFDALLLFTDKPALYERFGFRVTPEHRFVCRTTMPPGQSALQPIFRAIQLDLIERLLRTRMPISNVLGVTAGERAIFSFNCPDQSLFYAPALDALIWLEISGTTLRLFDIVAPQIPTLRQILACVPNHIDEVEFLFSPDQLDTPATPVLHSDGHTHLMVNGPFPAQACPFMVPLTAHC